MRRSLLLTLALTSVGFGMLSNLAQAQEAPESAVKFAAPQRLRAGGAFIGAGRLYPSPMLYDIDDDGRLDIVIGDLFGMLTFASRTGSAEGPITYSAKKTLEDSEGEKLDFSNW